MAFLPRAVTSLPCRNLLTALACRSTEAADAAAVGADGSGWVLAWPDVCQWVLGRPAPLWPLLFEQPLLERAKQLVERDFSTVVDEVTDLLGAALEVGAGAGAAAAVR